MVVDRLPEHLREDAVSQWQEAGLTRPWNDRRADPDRALEGPSSTVPGRGLLLAAGLLPALLVRSPGAESGPARGGPAPAQPPGKSGRSGGSGPSY